MAAHCMCIYRIMYRVHTYTYNAIMSGYLVSKIYSTFFRPKKNHFFMIDQWNKFTFAIVLWCLFVCWRQFPNDLFIIFVCWLNSNNWSGIAFISPSSGRMVVFGSIHLLPFAMKIQTILSDYFPLTCFKWEWKATVV